MRAIRIPPSLRTLSARGTRGMKVLELGVEEFLRTTLIMGFLIGEGCSRKAELFFPGTGGGSKE